MFIRSEHGVHIMLTFFCSGRERIVEFILNNPTPNIRVRELARQLKLSPAHISNTLTAARKIGIIKNGKVDLSDPYVKALKIYLNIKRIVTENIADRLRTLKMAGAGVYGSWANGTNQEESDLDIWIKVERHPGEMKVASVTADIRRAMKRNVQILVLTPERIRRLKTGDQAFYYSLIYGSILICGEAIE